MISAESLTVRSRLFLLASDRSGELDELTFLPRGTEFEHVSMLGFRDTAAIYPSSMEIWGNAVGHKT